MVSVKKLSVSLLCLMVGQSALLFAMEGCKPNNNVGEPVKGKIYLSPRALCYPSYHKTPLGYFQQKKCAEKVLGISSLNGDDPLVRVWITSSESERDKWLSFIKSFIKSHYPEYEKSLSQGKPNLQKAVEKVIEITQFPSHLPLSVLDGKEENDTVRLRIYGKQWVKLTCEQLPHRYDTQPKRFEDMLQILKRRFAKRPNYVFGDEDTLIQKEILVKKMDENGICKLTHGPNGFRLSSEDHQIANKERQGVGIFESLKNMLVILNKAKTFNLYTSLQAK